MSAGGNVARHHHYVPRFYLRGFLKHDDAKKPKLAAIDLLRGKTFSPPPEGVAQERDFHTIDVEGHPPDALEKAFSSFEAEAAEAFRRIVTANSIANDADFTCVLNLMSLLAVKNPQMRATLDHYQKRVFRMIANLAVSSQEAWDGTLRKAQAKGELTNIQPEMYEGVRDFVRGDQFDIHIPTTRTILTELEAQDPVLQALGQRHWSLIRAPKKSPGFVTSDHPVCLTWVRHPAHEQMFGPGFGTPNTRVVFPLTRHLAVMGSFEEAAFEADSTPRQLALLNGIIISQAHRQVYASSLEFEYLLGSGKKPKLGRDLLNDRFTLETRHSRK